MGKVKAEYRYLIDSNESTYQFPMGKVKLLGKYNLEELKKCINSLWER